MIIVLSLVALTCNGCGFGGFSGSNNTTGGSGGGQSTSSAETVLGGVASKGIIMNGTVRIYAIDSNGKVGSTIAETTTDAEGNFSVSIKKYSGCVLVEVTNGTYIDEFTGLETTLAIPLHTVADLSSLNSQNLSGSTPNSSPRLAITPLTELAYRHVRTNLMTAANISDANALLSRIFKVDIVGTMPVDLADFSSADQSQRDYALSLAALSKMAADNGGLATVMDNLSGDVSDDGILSVASSNSLKTALNDFLTSPNNTTSVHDIYQTNLVNIGGDMVAVVLATSGVLPPGKTIFGIETTLTLPPGVTLRADMNSLKPLTGIVTTSGKSPSGALIDARYTPPSGITPGKVTVVLGSQSGFVTGEFALVYCDLPPATQASQAGPFTLTTLRAYDNEGALLPDVVASQ